MIRRGTIYSTRQIIINVITAYRIRCVYLTTMKMFSGDSIARHHYYELRTITYRERRPTFVIITIIVC